MLKTDGSPQGSFDLLLSELTRVNKACAIQACEAANMLALNPAPPVPTMDSTDIEQERYEQDLLWRPMMEKEIKDAIEVTI